MEPQEMMMTAVPHKMGKRRSTRRHAGNEDVTGLMMIVVLFVLIMMSLALLPIVPWGALSVAIFTGGFLVGMGHRMIHHTGDRWHPIISKQSPVEDVVEPTMVIPSAEMAEEDRLAPRRHVRPTWSHKALLATWAVIAVLWLRNQRDRYDMEAFASEEGRVSIPQLPGTGMGSPGLRL
jgi:hypothetical protein